MTTYECPICLNVNHVEKLHCSTCGAVPAQYSGVGHPVMWKGIEEWIEAGTYPRMIPVLVAHGVDRQEHHRATRKRILRTVKLDYYAECAK